METINTKTIVGISFFFFHFLFFTPLRAQTDTTGVKKMCDDYVEPSKYIFQGKIISTKYITVKIGEYTYQNYYSFLTEVQKVIKGNIQVGTIEMLESAPGVVYKNGTSWQSMGQPFDGPPHPPNEAIYFCKGGKVSDVKDSNVANTNSKSLFFWDGITESNGILKKEKWGISRYFSTLSDFYAYLNANYGLK